MDLIRDVLLHPRRSGAIRRKDGITMLYALDAREVTLAPVVSLGDDFSGRQPSGSSLSINSYYLEKDGRPFLPISGELHYSRMDERRWEDELIKLRMGGVNTVSTYLFWNHIEEDENVFNFSGRRDIRRFVMLCRRHGLYVVLRIGPFVHGEARNGGLPDWLYGKPFEVRHTNEGFMRCVRRLYEQISEQVRGLFFSDGGPIIAVQLDNEYMHSSARWEFTTGISDEWIPAGSEGERYMLALRSLALSCGLKPVFFTATAWGGAAHGERILPLWGGYAYRPWLFYEHPGKHPATEEYVYEDYHHSGSPCADDFAPAYAPESRPYACCEIGAGMMCSYRYRFVFPGKSVDALANVKLGSGCNYLGYYMFHGGTNPIGRHGAYMNESQVPRLSYDYQAAVGEFGQLREAYRRLKSLHLFLRSFGERLAPMQTLLPGGASQIAPDDPAPLRFAVRTDGAGGFLFVNNFQDHAVMPDRRDEQVCIRTVHGEARFHIGIDSGENAILPFGLDLDGILLLYAQAQPVLRTVLSGQITYVFMVPCGMTPCFAFEDGVSISGDNRLFTAAKGALRITVLVLTRAQADMLFVLRDGSLVLTDGALLEDEQGRLRLETARCENMLLCYPPQRLALSAARLSGVDMFGRYTLSIPPRALRAEVSQTAPCRWQIHLPQFSPDGLKDARLQLRYRGDTASLFLAGRMISDHFCNGDLWEIGLMEHAGLLKREDFVLVITPLRKEDCTHAECTMAACREEAAGAGAALLRASVLPVYEAAL